MMQTNGFRRIAGSAIAAAALAMTGAAHADHCDPAQAPNLLSTNSATRVAAMRLCLAQVETHLHNDPTFVQRYGHGFTKVYSYGHPNKIAAMLQDSKQDFWDFTVGFQAR